MPLCAPPPRALLVEADATLRRALTTLLQAEGYEVTAVDTVFGTHALVRLLAPAVVLLDLELPYRSGLSLLPHLQADPQTAPIPVVVLTTLPALLPPARRPLATAVLTPPVSAPALHAALQTARSARGTPGGPHAHLGATTRDAGTLATDGVTPLLTSEATRTSPATPPRPMQSPWLLGQACDGQAHARSTATAARVAVARAQARPVGDLARLMRTTRQLRTATTRLPTDASA